MINVRSLTLWLMLLPLIALVGCDDDDGVEATSRVNFDETAYNVSVTDLSPVEVTLDITPAAPRASTIAVDFSGADAGTAFTTTPALSGSSVEIPVAEGDMSASFTVEFDPANLPAGDVVLEMALGTLGSGLGSGLTINSQINLANVEVTAIPYSEGFGEDCSGDFPPAEGGFTIVNTQENSAGDGGANTGSWGCGTFAMDDGAGAIGNAFVPGSASTLSTESWLISPILGPLTGSSTLSFAGDLRFNDVQAGFEWYDVFIATDYNGLNAETANWERLTEAYDALASNDVDVDDITVYEGIDLSAYEGQTVAIGFVYRCSAPSNCAAMRVDSYSITD